MRFGSLFTGIGGFDLALERSGWECAWQVEIDKKCAKLLAQRWPKVERHPDVRTVGTALARVDLICGGFPCQDLSVAGRRAGLAGERSGLWFEFHRILGIARPRWCLIENVPGLLSSDHGRDFLTILRGLVSLGYGVTWRVLDAQFFGLAQRRKRVFIVGSLGDGSAAPVLFEPASVRWDPAPRRAARERAGPTLASRARGGGGLGTDAGLDGGLTIAATLSSGGHPNNNAPGRRREDDQNLIPFSERQITHPENRSRCRPGDPSVGVNESAVPMIAWALQERDAKGADQDTKDGHLIVADPISASEAKTYTHEGNGFRLHNVMAVGENGRGETLTGDVSRSMSAGGGKPGQGYPAAFIPPPPWACGA